MCGSNRNLNECTAVNIKQNRIIFWRLEVLWKINVQVKTIFVMWWVCIIPNTLKSASIFYSKFYFASFPKPTWFPNSCALNNVLSRDSFITECSNRFGWSAYGIPRNETTSKSESITPSTWPKPSIVTRQLQISYISLKMVSLKVVVTSVPSLERGSYLTSSWASRECSITVRLTINIICAARLTFNQFCLTFNQTILTTLANGTRKFLEFIPWFTSEHFR